MGLLGGINADNQTAIADIPRHKTVAVGIVDGCGHPYIMPAGNKISRFLAGNEAGTKNGKLRPELVLLRYRRWERTGNGRGNEAAFRASFPVSVPYSGRERRQRDPSLPLVQRSAH